METYLDEFCEEKLIYNLIMTREREFDIENDKDDYILLRIEIRLQSRETL